MNFKRARVGDASSAAAASARWGMNHSLLEHVHLELYRSMHSNNSQMIPIEIKNNLTQTLESVFPEWTWCEKHHRITSAHQMGERHPHCSTCPISWSSVYNKSMTRIPTTLEQLKEIRQEWHDSHTEMIKLARKVRKDDGSVTEGAMASSATALTAETHLWQIYTIVAFDIVRRHLIESVFEPNVSQLAKGIKQTEVAAMIRKTSPTAAMYQEFLVDWTTDAATHHGGSNPVNQLFCFEHNQLGDLMPIQGFDAYNSSCWICPLKQTNGLVSRVRLAESSAMSDFVSAKDITILHRV
jgi:hypothetical protein